MKKHARPLALLLALVLCVGLMTACTNNAANDEDYNTANDTSLNSNSDSTTSSEETLTDEIEEAPANLIGKVSSTSDASITLTTYEADTEEIDYATLDLTTLTATGSWEEISVTEETTYWLMESGTETSAAFTDVTVDSTIAVTQDESGMQKIVILEKAQAEGDEVLEPIFAEVESIAEDGTLMLMVYAAEDTEVITDVTDYAAVDWDSYVYAFDTMEYVVPEDALIQIVGNQMSTVADASVITAGVMVVINQDDTGLTTIYIYQNAISAE